MPALPHRAGLAGDRRHHQPAEAALVAAQSHRGAVGRPGVGPLARPPRRLGVLERLVDEGPGPLPVRVAHPDVHPSRPIADKGQRRSLQDQSDQTCQTVLCFGPRQVPVEANALATQPVALVSQEHATVWVRRLFADATHRQTSPRSERLRKALTHRLRHLVGAEDDPAGGVDHEDAGRRAVDRTAIGRFLLEELLLAGLDEEVRDVEHACLELLSEEGKQLGRSLRVAGVLAAEVLGEAVDEAHLGRQEARGRKAADEAPAGVGTH